MPGFIPIYQGMSSGYMGTCPCFHHMLPLHHLDPLDGYGRKGHAHIDHPLIYHIWFYFESLSLICSSALIAFEIISSASILDFFLIHSQSSFPPFFQRSMFAWMNISNAIMKMKKKMK